MKNSPLPSRQQKKKRSYWPWVVALVCFLGAAVAGAMFASSSLLDKPKEEKKSAVVPREELLTAKDKATIMIMGVDERADDVGRSDTLMIATIDPDRDKAALLSIPRDTRVRIQRYGYDKINAAFAYGGEKLTQQTVEDFLGVNIDYYIIINTRSFIKIIDAIGGIDIDVEKRMYYEDPWDDDGGLLIDLKPGLQHMDGKTAVTYVRYRDEEGDIGRIKRQQKFMQACMNQFTSPSILMKLPTVMQEVMGSVRTNLSVRQLLEFAGTLKSAQKYGLRTDMVPGRPLYIDGISYWIPDISEMRFIIAEGLGIQVSSSMRSNFERAAREYENSIPSSATEIPESDNSIGKAYSSPKSSSKDKDKERSSKDASPSSEQREGKSSSESKKDSSERRDQSEEEDLPVNLDIPVKNGNQAKPAGEPKTPSQESGPEPTPVPPSAAPSVTDAPAPSRETAGKTR